MKSINKQLLETLCITRIEEQEEDHCVDKKLLHKVMKEVLNSVDDFQQALDDTVALYFLRLSGETSLKSILVDWTRVW